MQSSFFYAIVIPLIKFMVEEKEPHLKHPHGEEARQTEKQERGFLARASLFFLELVKLAILAGVTIGLVRYFLFKPFIVKGQSMEPAFHEQDYLIIDEITYRLRAPRRGEVIVFDSPIGNDHYLKRIIGLPGERVKVEDNKVIVYNQEHPQGVVVQEGYLTETTPGSVTVTVGDNQFFVLGDNRDASYDSRRFGPIDREDITGRVLVRGWPITSVTAFGAPNYNL